MHHTLNARVAAEIRSYLARKGTTQAELAWSLGWTPAYLSRRLTGRQDFSTGEIEQIQATLGIPLIAVQGAA
ncbi:MAG: helix-turn-helix domain-containing protein [Streptosporangiaceae bacterium]